MRHGATYSRKVRKTGRRGGLADASPAEGAPLFPDATDSAGRMYYKQRGPILMWADSENYAVAGRLSGWKAAKRAMGFENMTRILLLGRPNNVHVRALANETKRRGHGLVVLDPREFPRNGSITLRLSDRNESMSSSIVDLHGVNVGWFNTHETVRVSRKIKPAARRFARKSAQRGLEAFWYAAPFPWINDPARSFESEDKMFQLHLAKQIGFRVPRTIVTNDPKEVRALFRNVGDVVCKSISGNLGIRADSRIFTTRVTRADLARSNAIAFAPAMYQEYVAKKTEIRATVVGRRVFAAEIHSQEQARTRVDWRFEDPRRRVSYDAAKLPATIAKKCTQIARLCGLDYGGIDLVRTPENRYVFLEINSLPSWIFAEERAGLPITAALVDLFESRATKRS